MDGIRKCFGIFRDYPFSVTIRASSTSWTPNFDSTSFLARSRMATTSIQTASDVARKKLAWSVDISAHPIFAPLSHALSMSTHAECHSGFLKKEPQVLPAGCLAFRRFLNSVTSMASYAFPGLRSERSNTADTTKRSVEFFKTLVRYAKAKSALPSVSILPSATFHTSAETSTSAASRPKHPAFPTTAHPKLPGRPIQGTRPVNPCVARSKDAECTFSAEWTSNRSAAIRTGESGPSCGKY